MAYVYKQLHIQFLSENYFDCLYNRDIQKVDIRDYTTCLMGQRANELIVDRLDPNPNVVCMDQQILKQF